MLCRVSTKDKGQDTENQLAQLRVFCEKQDWTITREYVDYVSGKSADKRPEFRAMFSAASRREFDLVLFWSLDRFSREGVLPTLKHLEELTSYGVGWKSFMEQYFDSCGIFRDAVISIAATLAKQERLKISERTVAGLQRAPARPHRRPAKARAGPGQGAATAGRGEESAGDIRRHGPESDHDRANLKTA